MLLNVVKPKGVIWTVYSRLLIAEGTEFYLQCQKKQICLRNLDYCLYILTFNLLQWACCLFSPPECFAQLPWNSLLWVFNSAYHTLLVKVCGCNVRSVSQWTYKVCAVCYHCVCHCVSLWVWFCIIVCFFLCVCLCVSETSFPLGLSVSSSQRKPWILILSQLSLYGNFTNAHTHTQTHILRHQHVLLSSLKQKKRINIF